MTVRTTNKIEVRGDHRFIEVREVDVGGNYHRYALFPGQDLTGQPAGVVAVAADAWTPEIVAAYAAHVAANE